MFNLSSLQSFVSDATQYVKDIDYKNVIDKTAQSTCECFCLGMYIAVPVVVVSTAVTVVTSIGIVPTLISTAIVVSACNRSSSVEEK